MLASPESFLAGAVVYIDGLGDCANCEVTHSQPSLDNEVILELYDLLPKNYDGFTGMLMLSVVDVTGAFEVLGVPRARWDDYYMRLMYFHEELTRKRLENRPRK